MRSTYGKLIYILQDSPAALDFNVHAPVKTVYSFLKAKDGLGVLEDDLLGAATLSASVGRDKGMDSRGALDKVIAAKREAMAKIVEKHQTASLSASDIEQVFLPIPRVDPGPRTPR
jgi:hypothetical protein